MVDARLSEIRRTCRACNYDTVQGMLAELLAEVDRLRNELEQRGQVAADKSKGD